MAGMTQKRALKALLDPLQGMELQEKKEKG